jgi:hypothetical protein
VTKKRESEYLFLQIPGGFTGAGLVPYDLQRVLAKLNNGCAVPNPNTPELPAQHSQHSITLDL